MKSRSRHDDDHPENPDLEADAGAEKRPIAPWLTFAASAMLAAVLGLRWLEKTLQGPPPSAPVEPPPVEPSPPRPRHQANGSVPPELADPPPRPTPSARGADPSAPSPAADAGSTLDLDAVLDLLDRHRQRATYGAVAGVLGQLPIHVMRGRGKAPRHSWVVSQKTGQPSRYRAAELHPELLAREHVIADADELRAWLNDPE